MSPALRATALCAALLFLSGCAGNSTAHDATKHPREKAAPSAKEFGKAGKPAPLAGIADAIGCKAKVITEVDELRQGSCTSGKNRYTMLTFATEQGQHDWLSVSKDYGGTYLVGKRWSVTGLSTGSLSSLREKIGGDIEHGMSMSHGGSGGSHEGSGSKGGSGSHDGSTSHDGMDGM
ncbi:hypothetical protein HUT19_04845 [Streptomyces sp. NA02950]|uniref:hypothetical protein n=1 Tax=Streptomyces sp. NA02950 TaxID=2742137 RepID=UPI00158FAE79|nr:hypothetical protein [Streptomyces sp. NA02950]QKV91150.1 hypothetical protein HUT19_04845 [Streptomyces sp. NA02950]